MSYQDRWQALSARFLTLQNRERGLVFLTSLVMILALGWQFWVAPEMTNANQARARTATLNTEIRDLTAHLVNLQAELAKDPNAALSQRRERLQRRYDEMQARLETLAGGLVSPEAMVALLRQILSEHQALTLVSATHDGAVPVEPRPATEEGLDLYSHHITLTVSGRYFDLVEYLQTLEALDDRLGWSAMRYEIKEWPVGQMQILLKTLSLSEEWLGV